MLDSPPPQPRLPYFYRSQLVYKTLIMMDAGAPPSANQLSQPTEPSKNEIEAKPAEQSQQQQQPMATAPTKPATDALSQLVEITRIGSTEEESEVEDVMSNEETLVRPETPPKQWSAPTEVHHFFKVGVAEDMNRRCRRTMEVLLHRIFLHTIFQ